MLEMDISPVHHHHLVCLAADLHLNLPDVICKQGPDKLNDDALLKGQALSALFAPTWHLPPLNLKRSLRLWEPLAVLEFDLNSMVSTWNAALIPSNLVRPHRATTTRHHDRH